MPDNRRHRGPHPLDESLFDRSQWLAMQSAVRDLNWLWTRGYSSTASIKLVGDRYRLRRRQRQAVLRAACSQQACAARVSRRVAPSQLKEKFLDIDGLNVLLTVEAALGGGVLLDCSDGVLRDMASVHGSFRVVEETAWAVELIGDFLQSCRLSAVRWLIDAPVSNSGKLGELIREIAVGHDWTWTVDVRVDVDGTLARSTDIVATGDSVIIDRCAQWFSLPRELMAEFGDRFGDVWIVPMCGEEVSVMDGIGDVDSPELPQSGC